jgi:hypothetical protein
LIALVEPDARLTRKLIKVLENQPDQSVYIAEYLSRVQRWSPPCLKLLMQILKGKVLYESVHADLFDALVGNLQEPHRSEVCAMAQKMLFENETSIQQASLKMALIRWVLRHGKLNHFEVEALCTKEVDWWILKGIAQELKPERLGVPVAGTFMNMLLSNPHDDVARCAAVSLIEHEIYTFRLNNNINRSARVTLKFLGLIDTVGTRKSMIGASFSKILARRETSFDWQRFLNQSHSTAEQISLYIMQKFEMDIDACILRLDSLFDIILLEASKKIIPGTQYSYGSLLNAPPATLRQNLPKTLQALKALHDTRLLSMTAHPRHRNSGKPTRRLHMKDFRALKPLLSEALDEMEALFQPKSQHETSSTSPTQNLLILTA